jgi:hypothetical protein
MASLYLSAAQHDRLWRHLLPVPHELEEAAFLLARPDTAVTDRLVCEEVILLGPEDLAVQLSYHIELADHVRPRVIKRAHDTGLVLVEMHSHLGDFPARFSRSDLWGFEEWVPHVRWRLKGRAYGAIVVADGNFDGFFWSGQQPERLDTIEVPGQAAMIATALSPFQWMDEEEGDEDNE